MNSLNFRQIYDDFSLVFFFVCVRSRSAVKDQSVTVKKHLKWIEQCMVKLILERDNPIARCAARVFSRAVSIMKGGQTINFKFTVIIFHLLKLRRN